MADRILVVDDEPDILNLTRTILEKDGFQVVTASDGEDGLRKAEAEIPDLILLDLVMPGKSGLEVCKILKAQAKTKHLPVVMFTALGRDVDRKLTSESGADGHFTKPFTREALVAEVKQQLEKTRGERFSEQLGVTHEKLHGRKILLEFDPSTPYERFVRDFVMESITHTGSVLVLTKTGSAVRKVLDDEKRVDFVQIQPGLMLTPVLEKHREGPLNIVYDNLTDLILLTGPQNAYKFVQNSIGLLSDPRVTALFLFNPAAHEQRDAHSLRGLFSDQVAYGKQGASTVRMT